MSVTYSRPDSFQLVVDHRPQAVASTVSVARGRK